MSERPVPFLFKWRQAIKDSTLPPSSRHIAHALSDFGDEHGGDIWPSIARLAHDSGLRDRAVRMHLKGLERAGWIQIHHRYNKKGQTSSSYTLHIPEGFAAFPYEDRDEETAKYAATESGVTATNDAVTATNDAGDGIPVPTTSPRDLSKENSPLTSPAPTSATASTALVAVRDEEEGEDSPYLLDDEVVVGEVVDEEDRTARLVRLRAEEIAKVSCNSPVGSGGWARFIATTSADLRFRGRVAELTWLLAKKSDEEILEVLCLEASRSPGDRTRARVVLALADSPFYNQVPKGASRLCHWCIVAGDLNAPSVDDCPYGAVQSAHPPAKRPQIVLDAEVVETA